MPSDYILYDCEIISCIGDQPGYQCVKSWTDYEGMGVSVIAAYSSFDRKFHSFALGEYSNPLTQFDHFLQHYAPFHIIGFNSRNFDDKLMAANHLKVQTTYDVLEEIRLAAFGSSRWQDTPPGCSYSLGKIAEANGFAKTGTGELAPMLWQQGKRQEVIDYAINDVVITNQILHLGLTGELVDPNTGRNLKLRDLP